MIIGFIYLSKIQSTSDSEEKFTQFLDFFVATVKVDVHISERQTEFKIPISDHVQFSRVALFSKSQWCESKQYR